MALPVLWWSFAATALSAGPAATAAAMFRRCLSVRRWMYGWCVLRVSEMCLCEGAGEGHNSNNNTTRGMSCHALFLCVFLLRAARLLVKG